MIGQGVEASRQYLDEEKVTIDGYINNSRLISFISPKKIILISLLEKFDLDKYHQLLAWVAGYSRITTCRQGVFLPKEALQGLKGLIERTPDR